MSINIRFDSVDSRDKWIDETFPKRKCTDIPGLFEAKDAWIGVHWLKVEVTRRFPRKQKGSPIK